MHSRAWRCFPLITAAFGCGRQCESDAPASVIGASLLAVRSAHLSRSNSSANEETVDQFLVKQQAILQNMPDESKRLLQLETGLKHYKLVEALEYYKTNNSGAYHGEDEGAPKSVSAFLSMLEGSAVRRASKHKHASGAVMAALKTEVHRYITPTSLALGIVVGLVAVIAGGFGIDMGLNDGQSMNNSANWWSRITRLNALDSPVDVPEESYNMNILTRWHPLVTYLRQNRNLMPASWGFTDASDSKYNGNLLQEWIAWRTDAPNRWGELVVCTTASDTDLLQAVEAVRTFADSTDGNGNVGPLISALGSREGVKPGSCDSQRLEVPESYTDCDNQGCNPVVLAVKVDSAYPCLQLFSKFKVGSNAINGETTHDWFLYDKKCLTSESGGDFLIEYRNNFVYAYDGGTDGATTYAGARVGTPHGSIQLLSQTGSLTGLPEMMTYDLIKR